MKKQLLLLFIFFCFSKLIYSQDYKHAIGLRLGESNGFGAAVSYQQFITQKNRIELNLGWLNNTNSTIKLTALYQWVMPLKNDFYWYFGAGAGLFNFNNNNTDNTTTLLIAGNLGIEYRLDIPLQIALGVRPELGFISEINNLHLNTALSVRYRF